MYERPTYVIPNGDFLKLYYNTIQTQHTFLLIIINNKTKQHAQ